MALVRRARTLVIAVGISTALTLLTVASALADGGIGPWPK